MRYQISNKYISLDYLISLLKISYKLSVTPLDALIVAIIKKSGSIEEVLHPHFLK